MHKETNGYRFPDECGGIAASGRTQLNIERSLQRLPYSTFFHKKATQMLLNLPFKVEKANSKHTHLLDLFSFFFEKA